VLACGLTYYAHPTACAAALATLDVYADDKLFANAAALGPVLRRELDAIAGKLAAKSYVRGLGLLAALEVEAPLSAWQALSAELAAKKLSLHVDGKRGTAIFAPPLCITEQELVTGVRAFGEAAIVAFGAAS
jgi:4-aminobutyrate aminotransferase-like enzyme